MKVVIVGGVAGGATAAARLRRISEQTKIVVFEKDSYISYANCGLPYYIGGVITDKDKLQVQTISGMATRFNIDIRIKTEVLSIDLKNKKIVALDLNNNTEYEESFDKLVLSCGAEPIKPSFTGLENADNVFTLRNIPDTYKIKDYIDNNDIKKAVVVGGGFIGVEVAENLRHQNIAVTLIEKEKQAMRSLDFEMAQIVHSELTQNGIELVLGDGIEQFQNGGKTVVLSSGKKVNTDMTVLAIGVAPNNKLAIAAKIKVNDKGYVVTDKNFNVYDDKSNLIGDVYAVGDMIEVINPLDDSKYSVPLAWGANRQGRLVADVISGKSIKTSKILGANIIKIFSLTAASVGSNEYALKQKNIKFTAIHAQRANHASYYPGSHNIYLKLLYDKDSGKIFGAQAVGAEGTDKRIDIIASAMRLNASVYDLSDLEICYAPPYSSAKDPVNILGYIAENIRDNAYKAVYHDEIDKKVAGGGYLLDVRTPFEYNLGHIEGSVNIELDELREKIDLITAKKDSPIYVNCQGGLRSYLAINILRGNGFTNLYNLSGGYLTYKIYKSSPMEAEKPKTSTDDLQQVQPIDDIIELDCTGLQCPGPLMATYNAINNAPDGTIVKVTATDFGFASDVKNWAATNGHTILKVEQIDGKIKAQIQKGGIKNTPLMVNQKNATIVVFSGNLDKVLASMIIAQGAAAQGKDVTMFFTFWGLNALRKNGKIKVKKSLIERMFGKMMPKGADKLKLSNMHMFGMGAKMIKKIMKKKNVDSLPDMIIKAQQAGVKMVACTMSMDLMGIKGEELIDGIEFAGVATYISKNENVGTTLFI